jgi:outer membrane protein OmpA-like peptidoglycan-associated protein
MYCACFLAERNATPQNGVRAMSIGKRFLVAFILTSLLSALNAWSQASNTAVLSAEQMIEQLKAPKTRSLRNLNIEQVNTPPATATTTNTAVLVIAAAAAPQAKPSLSLLIQFDLNSARVKTESQQALSNLAVALQSQELLTSKFVVEGHTDATGRADYNVRLSQNRADAVRNLLVAQGVNHQRLQTTGKGATELANIADPTSYENRRVLIVNLE